MSRRYYYQRRRRHRARSARIAVGIRIPAQHRHDALETLDLASRQLPPGPLPLPVADLAVLPELEAVHRLQMPARRGLYVLGPLPAPARARRLVALPVAGPGGRRRLEVGRDVAQGRRQRAEGLHLRERERGRRGEGGGAAARGREVALVVQEGEGAAPRLPLPLWLGRVDSPPLAVDGVSRHGPALRGRRALGLDLRRRRGRAPDQSAQVPEERLVARALGGQQGVQAHGLAEASAERGDGLDGGRVAGGDAPARAAARRGDDDGGRGGEVEAVVVREPYPAAELGGAHGEDVPQHVDLELVEVAVDAGAEERL